MLQTKNLTKIFTTQEVETTALNNVNLEVQQGEFVAVMGPSGCGKSTLLHIAGMLDNPTDGEYYFMGEEVSEYSEKKRANLRKGNIGFVFQSFNLIDELTVFENIELPLLYLGVAAKDRKRRVDDSLEQLELVARRNHFPQQISGGQQQRVAVARALIADPKVILADEPTGNLDSRTADAVFALFTELVEKGKAILMVTHDDDLAQRVTRTITIADGEIVADTHITIAAAAHPRHRGPARRRAAARRSRRIRFTQSRARDGRRRRGSVRALRRGRRSPDIPGAQCARLRIGADGRRTQCLHGALRQRGHGPRQCADEP